LFFYIIKKLSGYNNWKNSSSHLKEHASTKAHISCITALIARNNVLVNVGNQLVLSHTAEVISNRENFAIIIEVVKLLSKQSLAFRAHRENSEKNKGNFLETILFTGNIFY
jgi:hypothetical protein